MNDSQYFRVYGTMDQETRWLTKYKEVMEFIERCHRNPSRHRIEEHDMLNWVKANRKRMNARELKEPRLGKFKELLALSEQYWYKVILRPILRH